MIVAIDGPAGSGKSTTARALAERTGFLYLDTGAMYRAVALQFLETGAEPTETAAFEVLGSMSLDVDAGKAEMSISIDGRDVTHLIRSREVTQLSSVVSAFPAVRLRLVADQRRIAERESARGRGVIVEGRDIGTVVFPDAEVKIYLDADPRERARRRMAEMKVENDPVDTAIVEADIRERDQRDQTRDLSPLSVAPDAVVVDTTHLSFKEQIDLIEALIREQSKQ